MLQQTLLPPILLERDYTKGLLLVSIFLPLAMYEFQNNVEDYILRLLLFDSDFMHSNKLQIVNTKLKIFRNIKGLKVSWTKTKYLTCNISSIFV